MMSTGPDFFLDLLCLTVYSTDDVTRKLVSQALDVYKEELGDNAALQDKVIKLYVSITEEIISSQINTENESELLAVIMKFEHNPIVADQAVLMEKIKSLIIIQSKVSPKRVEFLQRKVRNWILWHHSNSKIRLLFKKSQQCAIKVDPFEQDIILNELLENARDLIRVHEGISGIANDTIDMIDMSNIDSIKNAMMRCIDTNQNGTLKMGLQGFNRLFGKNGGPKRGEFCGVGALSHHYKSGLLMSIARWIAMYNKPKVAFGKKPLIVFISLENEIYKNLEQWFFDLYANMFQTRPDNLTIDEIVSFLYNEFNKHGYHLFVYRKDAEYFGFPEFNTLHSKLEEDGYEVVASIIDYAGLMKLDDGPDNQAKKLQNLGTRLKTFANHKNILTFTGFQLDAMAATLANSGQTYIVKRYGTNHLSDCKSLIKELDWFAFMHIEQNHNDIPYLTWAWKKHRYNDPPTTKDKFCAYRMGIYGIMDDLHGADRSVMDIYSDSEEEDKEGEKTDVKPQFSLF